MQTIYLIRHGQAENSQGRCIGRTDLPLSGQGRRQAQLLAEALRRDAIQIIYSSPLARCRDTANILGECLEVPVILCPELMEVDTGEWEGLPFSEIRSRWPQEYQARGEHIGSAAPPGGESFLQAGQRLTAFIMRMQREELPAIVTHAGIIRGFVTLAQRRDPDAVFELPQPNAGITELKRNGSLRVGRVGVRPWLPDEECIEELYQRAETPEAVRQHCRAVAQRACEIAMQQHDPVNMDSLRTAALLHDLYRARGRSHPKDAAALLVREGWPELAERIEFHHDLSEDMDAEAEILALADMLTQGTSRVTLEERFEESRKKCQDEDAVEAWTRRYEQAKRIYRKYMKETAL